MKTGKLAGRLQLYSRKNPQLKQAQVFEILQENLKNRREVKKFQCKLKNNLQKIIKLITELGSIYERGNAKRQTQMADENEKVNDEFCKVMDQAQV